MHKKYHKKFKILDILAVTTQAREGIETPDTTSLDNMYAVTTQAREGIETAIILFLRMLSACNNSSPRGH